MKSNNHLLMSFILINIIFISLSNVAGSIVWFNWDDEVDDVIFFNHYYPQFSGDYHDEIDIIGVHLNSTDLVFIFQAAPIYDINHTYHLTVYWSYTAEKNYTSAIFGHEINEVATYLQNSAGMIVGASIVLDSITIGASSLLVPIPLFAEIPRTDKPEYVIIQSTVVIGQDLEYRDYFEGTTFCKPYSTTPTLSESYTSIFVVVCILLAVIIKKK